jgi:hypothetical protein
MARSTLAIRNAIRDRRRVRIGRVGPSPG